LLITRIHFDDIDRPARVAGFIRKRFARIYPFYWFCRALLLVALLAVPGLTTTPLDLAHLLTSLTLVGGDAPRPAQ
jgi:peptidoglycan/LPS O-acetylase OafA/YrhL